MNELINLAWVAICTALVFFMQAGFALVEGGLIRAKNSINVIMKIYLGTCLVGVSFWAVGYGLAFGDSAGGWFGVSGFVPLALKPMEGIGLLYQMMFATTAVSIVSGAIAERARYGAYLVFALVMGLLVFPVFAHWAWNPNGWLKQLGFVDFAGDGAVHSVGAWCSLAGLLALGPRLGRFGRNGEVRDIPGHNLPMVALGGFVLWLGWFGFNGGSISGLDSANLGIVLLNTYLGGCAGGLGSLAYQRLTGKQVLMTTSVNGSLAGLVAITGGAGSLNPATALLTGLIGGVLASWGAERIRRLRIDDAVDAIAVHGIAGTWGLIAAGLFFEGDLFNLQRVGVQLLGIVACFAWSFPVAFMVFKAIDKVMGLRAPTQNEQRGLDFTEHFEIGYPEFQDSPSRIKMEG
ncbi:ammonium transporter [Sphaerotilus hippei]|uniref:Ammonium transporter n=1 Tax=Sphaerotilus hippei TaxID=744406 RepID=A0A318GWY1_9BURK|nr:ammonium transporter [Sphaerotilus hippei]PXW94168.1 ammonium transporter [Sphaerotilus hippei]